MIRLFYTGANSYLGSQTSATNSLGGYISSTPFKNGSLDGLFSDVSALSISQGASETKMLALKNEGTTKITGLKIYYVYDKNAILKMTISAIKPTKSADCQYYFETLDSSKSLPIYSQDFYEPDSQYASARLDFTLPALSGEVITIVGVSTAPAPSNLSLEDTYKLVESAFKNNANYTAVFMSVPSTFFNQTGEQVTTYDNYLLVTTKIVGNNTNLVTFSSTGQVALKQSVNFSGGFDNSLILGDIEPGQYLGIWFKKEILPVDTSSPCVVVQDLSNEDKTETIQLFFEY